MLDLDGLLKTIEPLVLQIHALQDELATLKAAPPIGPLLGAVEAMQGQLATLEAHRLDVPAWAAGVYRQGSVVQHFHGQYFEAVADTAAEPGDGVAWRRLGLHGFRYRGLYIDGAQYETGDLVARDGSMLLQTAGTLVWLAIRGKEGKRGAPGKAGEPGAPGMPGLAGTPGKPGAALVRLEAEAGVLFGVWDDGGRAPIAFEATGAGA